MSDSFQVEVILTSLQDLKQGQVYISPRPSVSHSHTHPPPLPFASWVVLHVHIMLIHHPYYILTLSYYYIILTLSYYYIILTLSYYYIILTLSYYYIILTLSYYYIILTSSYLLHHASSYFIPIHHTYIIPIPITSYFRCHLLVRDKNERRLAQEYGKRVALESKLEAVTARHSVAGARKTEGVEALKVVSEQASQSEAQASR